MSRDRDEEEDDAGFLKKFGFVPRQGVNLQELEELLPCTHFDQISPTRLLELFLWAWWRKGYKLPPEACEGPAKFDDVQTLADWALNMELEPSATSGIEPHKPPENVIEEVVVWGLLGRMETQRVKRDWSFSFIRDYAHWDEKHCKRVDVGRAGAHAVNSKKLPEKEGKIDRYAKAYKNALASGLLPNAANKYAVKLIGVSSRTGNRYKAILKERGEIES